MNNTIKKLSIVVGVLGYSACLSAEIPAPNWQQNAQQIIDMATAMRTTLDQNVLMYNALAVAISTVRDGFVVSDAQRTTTFAALEQRFADLSSQLAQLNTNKDMLISQTDASKANLVSQIALLGQSSADEIVRLTGLRDDLITQISILNGSFVTMTGDASQEASDIVATLNGFVSSFDTTIAKQAQVVSDINALLAFVETDNLQTQVENEELHHHICDPA